MRTAFILHGLPGSGKSTFARELLKKEPERWKRINRDDLRNMLDGGQYTPNNEAFVKSVKDQLVREALRSGFDVVIDDTHLVTQVVKKLHRLLESIGDVKVLDKCFNVTVEECLHRNALREGSARVPDKVIHEMAQKAGICKGRRLEDRETYYPPLTSCEPLVQDDDLPTAIICDLDGTLAILGDRSPYDASECDVKDSPNPAVVECVKAMWEQGHEIIFMSGREEKDREPTERFISKHLEMLMPKAVGLTMGVETGVLPHQLFMRPTGDQRKDNIVKRELFDAHVRDKYFVTFVLDDRDQVVDLWRRELGLSCFQVGDGAF